MFCDFIQATIDASPASIRSSIMRAGLAHSAEPQATGGMGYKQAIRFLDPARDSHITLYHDSANANPSLKCSGSAAAPAFDLIRRVWPDHSVSRVDWAQDYSEKGGFRRACRSIRALAKRHGMHDSGVGIIPLNPEMGATLGVGSRGSAVYVRCYEKSKELLKKGKITQEQFDPDAYRIEIELRPSKSPEKKLFAKLDPASQLGYSASSRDFANKFFGIDAPTIDRLKHQTADCDKSWEHFMKQIKNVAYEKAVADNNRYIGLAEPTFEDLASIAAQLFHDTMLQSWKNS